MNLDIVVASIILAILIVPDIPRRCMEIYLQRTIYMA